MIGSLISAGASLLGGLFGKSSADKAADLNAQMAERNIAMQREFAQNGIQWKAEDAKKAGIHPLYAMGASTPSFSPVSANFTADTSMPNALSRAGQDIGRAIDATRNTDQKAAAYTQAVAKLSLEKAGLENDVLRADLASKMARLRQQAQPPMPVGQRYMQGLEGLAPGGKIEEKFERVPAEPSAPHSEAGSVTDVGHSRTASGGYAVVPSKDVAERIEDNWLQQVMWTFRNNILPSIGDNQHAPAAPLPKGYDKWLYHPFYQEYRPHKRVPYLPFDLYY